MGHRKHEARKRGAVIAIVVASILTLLLFGSLAVDVGYICALTAEQQNIADASALAGASGLQDADWNVALERTLDFIERNQKTQGFLSLDDQLIEFGWWDSVNHQFHVYEDRRKAFAVRVRAARNEAPLFFAAIMGKDRTNVSREAVAVGSKPCGGIWGLEGVEVPGEVVTDSFISTDGLYDPGDWRSHGDVCSGRGIVVSGSIIVNGDAMAGLGYPIIVNGGPIITGLTTSTLEDVVPPPVDFGDVEYNNDNETIPLTSSGVSAFSDGLHLRVKSQDNLTLEPGTYYLESMTLGGGSTLTLTGPTTFYVKGDVKATGGAVIGTDNNPHNLTVISTGSRVHLGGNTSFHGQVMAPYAEVNLGGGADWYGAVIGRTVKLSGTYRFHVDESVDYAKPWFNPPPPMLVK